MNFVRTVFQNDSFQKALKRDRIKPLGNVAQPHIIILSNSDFADKFCR